MGKEDLLSPREKSDFLEERKIWQEHKKFNPYFKSISDRIDKDDDAIVCLGGQRRTGKSTLGDESCLYGYEDWTPWNDLIFTIKDMIAESRRSEKGRAIFWDEIGTDYTAYRFMSMESVKVTGMLEMIGDKNLLLVFTAPSFPSFSKGGRKNVTHYVSVRRGEGDSRGFARAYKLWLDDWHNKIGRHSLCDFVFHRLPNKLYNAYDVYKRRYLDEYMKRSEEEIFLKGIKNVLPHRAYDVFYTIFISEDEGMTYGELAEMFGNSTAAFALKVLKAKGYATKEGAYYIVEPSIMPS